MQFRFVSFLKQAGRFDYDVDAEFGPGEACRIPFGENLNLVTTRGEPVFTRYDLSRKTTVVRVVL